jgi:hypothetical protein
MTSTTQKDIIDYNPDEKKLPSMLNVLTILTFIGCAIGFISSVWGYTGAQKNYDSMQENVNKMENMPSAVKSMMGPDPLELSRRTLENKMPILILGLLGSALCLYGAIQMRQLKKQGFAIYVIGELLPVAAMAIFIGMGLYSTLMLGWIFVFIIAFIIMYATQLKYLK